MTHIVSTPETAHGAPRIDGRRVRVQDIVNWHLLQGMSIEEVAEQFDLNLAQVHAALAYYYDHRDEIDADLKSDIAAAEQFRLKYPSKFPPAPGG